VREGGRRVEERIARPRAEMSDTEEYMLPALSNTSLQSPEM
jgi:hypothetical protein